MIAITALALLVLAAPCVHAQATTQARAKNTYGGAGKYGGRLDAVNARERAAKPTSGRALHLQVLLDRAGFSPGEIDGAGGRNTQRAMAAYARAHNLGAADPPSILAALDPTTAPALMEYTITAEDAAGPFIENLPRDLMEQSTLPALSYGSIVEALAEKFHASPQLLRRLNPSTRFVEGDQIRVPNVVDVLALPANAPPAVGNVRVELSKSDSSVTVRDESGEVVFHAPVTSGSERDPLPIGEWKVTGVFWNPPFHYNPDLFWDANPQHARAKIQPGPNNPVGVVWIDLNKEHFGIHGTPEPAAIGTTNSHGCVRLTNWDASRLARLVKKGTTIAFIA